MIIVEFDATTEIYTYKYKLLSVYSLFGAARNGLVSAYTVAVISIVDHSIWMGKEPNGVDSCNLQPNSQ